MYNARTHTHSDWKWEKKRRVTKGEIKKAITTNYCTRRTAHNRIRQVEINDKICCASTVYTPTFISPRTINFLINFNEFIQTMLCFGDFVVSVAPHSPHTFYMHKLSPAPGTVTSFHPSGFYCSSVFALIVVAYYYFSAYPNYRGLWARLCHGFSCLPFFPSRTRCILQLLLW